MRDGLERALGLLGYPIPDYAARDQEWQEENRQLEDSDEDNAQQRI